MKAVRRTADEMGWLRRGELGDGVYDVWEQPCGCLIATHKDRMPVVMVFDAADRLLPEDPA